MSAFATSATVATVYYIADTIAPEPKFGPAFWTVVVSLLMGYTWDGYKDWRNRRWRMIDEKAKALIAEQVEKQSRLAEEHDKAAQQGRQMLAEKIKENTKATVEGIAATKEAVVHVAENVAAVAKVVKAETPHAGQMVSSPLLPPE